MKNAKQIPKYFTYLLFEVDENNKIVPGSIKYAGKGCGMRPLCHLKDAYFILRINNDDKKEFGFTVEGVGEKLETLITALKSGHRIGFIKLNGGVDEATALVQEGGLICTKKSGPFDLKNEKDELPGLVEFLGPKDFQKLNQFSLQQLKANIEQLENSTICASYSLDELADMFERELQNLDLPKMYAGKKCTANDLSHLVYQNYRCSQHFSESDRFVLHLMKSVEKELKFNNTHFQRSKFFTQNSEEFSHIEDYSSSTNKNPEYTQRVYEPVYALFRQMQNYSDEFFEAELKHLEERFRAHHSATDRAVIDKRIEELKMQYRENCMENAGHDLINLLVAISFNDPRFSNDQFKANRVALERAVVEVAGKRGANQKLLKKLELNRGSKVMSLFREYFFYLKYFDLTDLQLTLLPVDLQFLPKLVNKSNFENKLCVYNEVIKRRILHQHFR